VKKIAFVFPGQGSQFVGMGYDIYQDYDIVREIFDMASEVAKINLAKLCFKGPIEDLTSTVNLQPAITAVNLGFLAVIEKESVQPAICAGHSLGEYSALCAASVISRQDSMRLVVKRAELMHRESTKHTGVMHAVVGLPIEEVQKLVDTVKHEGVVSIANHNTELQIVITGSPGPVEKVSSLAVRQGAKAIPLKVSGAWHSELIREAQEEFKEHLYTVAFTPPRSAIVFNVTAEVETNPDEIRSIMAKQLCSQVKWYDSMLRMIETDVEVFAEVGPGKVLTGLLKKTLPRDYPGVVFSVNNIKTLEQFLKAAG